MDPTYRSPVPVNVEDEMRVSYMDYAMSVIIGRALPDARDGLKPVHRRVLYTMSELKNSYNSSYKKSARIVGDCIGKYHPHGDTAVYDTIVRMAQSFSLRYTLVDGQGNFGSVDGDPAAAMRYTEVRMAKITHEILADLEKDTVEFGPTYDDSDMEPLVLPTKIPNLLVNGSSGIAVGMATNIPPHNLNEIIDACLAVMTDPDVTLADLMQIVPGPDFPTGGIIYGTAGIHEAYENGRGIVRIRAVTHVEDMPHNRERIVVDELPYQVNKAKLLEKIAELVREKRIEGISDLRDESDRRGMRMVIELKRDGQPQVVLNQLFKLTKLQHSFGINMLAIVHGEPRVLSLREALDQFIGHRRDVTQRRCRFELKKYREREHVLEGYVIALDNIEEIIRIIRGSQTSAEARIALIERFSLSLIQAQAILDMRLRRLTGLEREEVVTELGNIRTEIERLVAILADDGLLMAVIRGEMEAVREQYGDARRTQITSNSIDLSLEDLIPVEDMVVTISHSGYIKRVVLDEYNTQRRGGRGKSGMGTKDEDSVEHLFVASTHSTMLFFTNTGRVFSKRIFHLPKGSRLARGKPIVNVLEFEPGETLAMTLAVPEFTEGNYLVFATAMGRVKKTDLMAYSNIRTSGIYAINLKEGDRVISVRQTTGDGDLFLTSRSGSTIRFSESRVRPLSRKSAGVIGMKFRDPTDEVVACVAMSRNDIEENIELLIATSGGYGKRSTISLYREANRGGFGVYDIKTEARNGHVIGVIKVERHGDEYLLVTNGGVIIRAKAGTVRVTARNTLGVKLINLGKQEEVVSLARYPEGDEEEATEETIEGEIVEGAETTASDAPAAEVAAADADGDDDGDDDGAVADAIDTPETPTEE